MKFETLMYIHNLLEKDVKEKTEAFENARNAVNEYRDEMDKNGRYLEIEQDERHMELCNEKNSAWDAQDAAQEAFNDFMTKEWN